MEVKTQEQLEKEYVEDGGNCPNCGAPHKVVIKEEYGTIIATNQFLWVDNKWVCQECLTAPPFHIGVDGKIVKPKFFND